MQRNIVNNTVGVFSLPIRN